MARKSKTSSLLSPARRARLIKKLEGWRMYLNKEFGVPAVVMAATAIALKHSSWWAAFFLVILLHRRVFNEGTFPSQDIAALRRIAKTDPRAKAELRSVMQEGLSYRFLLTSSLPFLMGYVILFLVLVCGPLAMCVPAARPFIQSWIGSP
jgi:hypothetical protein